MRDDWSSEILKEATIFKSGKTVSPKIEKESGEILYTKVGDMNLEGNEEFMTISTRYVNMNDINENQIIPIGSVIFPKRGGAIATNKKRRIIKPTIVDLNTMAVAPTDKLNADYLYYWFESIDLQLLSNGTSIPQINNNSFDNVYITYPKSLQEQQQIVAILDEAFTAIDQAKANIEKNIANAKELFQSKLNEIFSQKGDGWEEKKLTDVIILKSGTTLNKSFEKQEGEIPYLKISDMNIEGNEFEITTSTKFVNSNDIKESNILPSGTIIFPKRGGAIATNKKRITTIPICVDLNTMGAIPVDGLIPEYLHFYFMSFDLLEIANGTTIPQINNYSFESLKISIPNDKKNQIQIIETLGAARQFIDDLVVGYSIKLNSLDELKKSILQKAFSGELTTKTLKINN